MKTHRIEFCDFKNPTHVAALGNLLNHYMGDPMGDHPSHNKEQQLQLVNGLATFPTALVLFLYVDNQAVGMVVCFELFSTFHVKPYLYIHDVIIHKDFRGKGLGSILLEEVVLYSTDKKYCKITLEVRADNHAAQRLYQSLGFAECEPIMHFWTKLL